MKKILLLFLLTLIGYFWILIFRFCHPYPKFEFYIIIWIQLGVGFIPYLFGGKLGRIFVIIFGLTLVRLGPNIGTSSPIITLMGVFLGGVFGNLITELWAYYKDRKKDQPEVGKESLSFFSNTNHLIVIFLIALTFDRFFTYFNAPYLNGFGILETMYLPNLSSKEAFALSMESICNLLFPLLYFFSEELRADDKEEIRRDWKIGILFGLGIQIIVIILQILWNRNLFADNTNFSLEANRVMGLFRDSGSSSWIFPILCFLFYEELLRSKKFFYFPLGLIILIQAFIGPYQGRGFWLIFFFGLLFLSFFLWNQNKANLPRRSYYWIGVGFILSISILLLIPKDSNSSFDRLFSIPMKLIMILQSGNISLLDIDPARYYLNLAAIKLFLTAPFFGHGIGSFIVNLKDASLHLVTHENKIDNPSLLIGVFSEIGTIGVTLICLYFISHFRVRRNFILIFLLIPVFAIGNHIIHPDGGFAILLTCAIGFGLAEEKEKRSIFVNTIMIICILAFLFNSVLQIFNQAKLPEFRKEKTNSFQLLAYELNRKNISTSYHIFKGKTIWVLAGSNEIEVDAFLDNSTAKEFLNQRWSFLDRDRNAISDFEIVIRKENPETNLLKIPNNAYYLQVEELNEKGESSIYGEVPYCLPAFHFSIKNEIL